LKVTQEPLGKDRSIFAGTPEQIKEDTAAAGRLGRTKCILSRLCAKSAKVG